VSSRVVVVMAVANVALGLGAVTAPARAHSEVPRCDGHEATIVGSSYRDSLQGTAGSDVIVGLGGGDHIDGGGGNDSICGGPGRDQIDGGIGDDRIHGNRGRDTLTGGDGDDRLFGNRGVSTTFYADQGDDRMVSRTGRDRLSYEDAPQGISVDLGLGTATGWGTDSFHIGSDRLLFFGSSHDDILLGSSGSDSIHGEQGNDTIAGRGGDDDLVALAGSIVGGAGDDYISASPGGSVGTSWPTSSALDMDGGSGDDLLVTRNPGQVLGGPGDDLLSVEWGYTPFPTDLSLDGGDGMNTLDMWGSLSSGSVTYDMGSGSLVVDSVAATTIHVERFLGHFEDWNDVEITGTAGPDSIVVYGNTTATIHALGGDDLLRGGNGDDLIDGGPGADTADGSDGTDTCVSVEHPSNCEVVNG
jgi:Ca2+-binding RTX toxin-like protein